MANRDRWLVFPAKAFLGLEGDGRGTFQLSLYYWAQPSNPLFYLLSLSLPYWWEEASWWLEARSNT